MLQECVEGTHSPARGIQESLAAEQVGPWVETWRYKQERVFQAEWHVQVKGAPVLRNKKGQRAMGVCLCHSDQN